MKRWRLFRPKTAGASAKKGIHRFSITQRWLINSLGVIFIILTAVVIGFSLSVQTYFYSSARQVLTSKMNMLTAMMSWSALDSATNFSSEVRNMVENFSDRDKMELMALDSSGRIALTSSGFTPRQDAPLPVQEPSVSNGMLYEVSRSNSGEKMMALTSPITVANNSGYGALRLVVSLEEIDRLIATCIFALSVICLAILLLMLFSGMYFVKSIVIPVRQIGATARKFATGDFSTRIQKKHDDEIGELCDVVNYMADELSNSESMKNEFISSVSHELRTPLTAIKGWAETISEMTDDRETVQKGMRVITNETERLSQMVEELLDFSRMQNGRFTLVMDRMDLLAELGEAVLTYTERAKREGMELIYDEPAMLPFVYGDKNRIRQVFINVIDNAIKYSEKGGKITVHCGEVEGNRVEVAVEDEGCGIAQEDLPKIKTKFFKANQTRRGSGIGLAVANEIITMHHGSLELFSKIGLGTTVVISLPTLQDPKVQALMEKERVLRQRKAASSRNPGSASL